MPVSNPSIVTPPADITLTQLYLELR
jgi:hypothetical protein